jgi:hypothetical protein
VEMEHSGPESRTMMASPAIDRLHRLAACLHRPVSPGLLSPAVAEVAPALSTFRADLGGLDTVAMAEELRVVLWRPVE